MSFKDMSNQYKTICDCLCGMVIHEEISYEESVLVEVSRVSINAYIFKDYIDKILDLVEPEEDGTMDLNTEELANIYKCIKTLSDSKVKLLESSISLELH